MKPKKLFYKNAIYVPLVLILTIWTVFYFQVDGVLNGCYGIISWDTDSLRGVALSPFFHGNFEHLVSNTLPFIALVYLLFQFYQKIAWQVLTIGWIATGLFVWLLPDVGQLYNHYACHIGASGIIYMLAFFLFFSGIFKRKIPLMAISFLVVFLYGGLVWGIFPQELLYGETGKNISWQSHLCGAAVGVALAFIYNGDKPPERIETDQEKIYNEQLWEAYKEKCPEDFESDESSKI